MRAVLARLWKTHTPPRRPRRGADHRHYTYKKPPHITVVPASETVSPRRQSLRLQKTQAQEPATSDVSNKKNESSDMPVLWGRQANASRPATTSQETHRGKDPLYVRYAGCVHVCKKAYKAKRSLHLHQLSYHQEIFDSTNGLDLSGASPAAVSASTTNLLRETLESRRLARLSVGTDSEDVTLAADGDTADESIMEPHDLSAENNISAVDSPVSAINTTASSIDTGVDDKAASIESEKEGEETADDVSKRSCPYCFKVCLKPSDMKRHLMVHTGERPFLCQVCQKRFKQKGSLLYHQRAAHDLDVELSQGLEERYLRLKTRSAMRSLAAMDGLASHPAQDSMTALPLLGSSGATPGLDSKSEDSVSKSDLHFPLPSHLSKDRNSCSASSIDFHQGLSRQISHTSDGSWTDDHGGAASIVEVDIPDSSFDRESNMSETDSKQQQRMRVAVRRESVVVTKLDAFCLGTGGETTLFRCYVCGKICASLYETYSHLAIHFDPKDGEAAEGCSSKSDTSEKDSSRVTFGVHSCTICRKGFTSQYLLMRHMHLHKQQLAIEAMRTALYSGATTNGIHQELLLKPPAVLPQNADVDLGIGAFVRGKNPVFEEGNNEKVKAKLEEEKASEDGDEMVVPPSTDVASAKELLEIEGIQEDVTVVMPSDPDMDEEDEKEGPQVKSRRKATLPTRFNHEARTSPGSRPLSPNTSSLSSLSPPPSTSQSQPANPEEVRASLSLHDDGKMSTVRSRSPSADDEPSAKKRETEDEELLLARQSKYVQSLHAAFSGLSSGMFPNGFPPSASLAMAAAGFFGPFPGVPPSFSTHPAVTTHGSAASSTLLVPPPPPPRMHQVVGKEGQKCRCKPKTFPCHPAVLCRPQNPSHLLAQRPVPPPHPPTSATVWSGTPGSSGPDQEEAYLLATPPPLHCSSRPPPASSSGGKHVAPVWHTLTSEDIGNATTTDGRKVTSLSRTHSRLYVVNQPVDRERLCKPTVLPDGRTVYRCVFCHKDFLSYSDINRHMDFHEDIRPYKCNFCDYYARTNSQLKVHMMRHQGIRGYCCRLCNYKGVTQSDLNRHMKSQIHLLKSHNECTRCGEGFVTTKNLEKHVSAGCTGRHKMDMEDP
ncbi:hypothetical protein BaRGS_00035959 [Batillaria attramentaria]|uniref:C2H2-type domain-containing protein n=1 Tax=Batillaria attramentaria TaxID=370345 RepID=A0ABD0JD81_9CAEN